MNFEQFYINNLHVRSILDFHVYIYIPKSLKIFTGGILVLLIKRLIGKRLFLLMVRTWHFFRFKSSFLVFSHS